VSYSGDADAKKGGFFGKVLKGFPDFRFSRLHRLSVRVQDLTLGFMVYSPVSSLTFGFLPVSGSLSCLATLKIGRAHV
jgi:hypothetical protein